MRVVGKGVAVAIRSRRLSGSVRHAIRRSSSVHNNGDRHVHRLDEKAGVEFQAGFEAVWFDTQRWDCSF